MKKSDLQVAKQVFFDDAKIFTKSHKYLECEYFINIAKKKVQSFFILRLVFFLYVSIPISQAADMAAA